VVCVLFVCTVVASEDETSNDDKRTLDDDGAVVIAGRKRRLSSVSTVTGDELQVMELEVPVDVDPVNDTDAGTETISDDDAGYCL